MGVYGTSLYGTGVYGGDALGVADLRVDMWYSQKWNNITADVMPGLDITRGRDAEDATGAAPASCVFNLKNLDAQYSPRNASSPLFGLIGRNTQVRVGVGVPPVAATGTGTGTAMSAPAVTAEATGLQVTAFCCNAVGNFTMPAGFTTGTERDGNLSTFRDARLADVAAGSTGAESATTSASGDWVGLNVHMPGATSSASGSGVGTSGGDVNIAVSFPTGDEGLLAITGWSSDPGADMMPPKCVGEIGVGWTLLADSGPGDGPRLMAWWSTPSEEPGVVSFVGARDGVRDTFMSVHVVTGQAQWFPRFVGEISEFPQRWDQTGTYAYVPIRASAASRRVQASDATLAALEASMLARGPAVVAYWPLTDTTGATQFSSLVPGGSPMVFASGADGLSPAPALGGYSGLAGTQPVATFDDAGAAGAVTVGDDTGEYGFGVVIHFPDSGVAAGANLITCEFEGGTISACVVEYTSTTETTRKIIFRDGTSTSSGTSVWSSAGFPDGFPGTDALLFFQVRQNGADVDFATGMCNLSDPDGSVFLGSSTAVGATIGVPTRMGVGVELGVGSTLHTTPIAMGHAFVLNDITSIIQSTDPTLGAGSVQAWRGWDGDKNTDRIFRLTRDAAVHTYVQHDDTETDMGRQSVASLAELLRECEESSSGGRLSDAAGFLGYTWRNRESKESNEAKFTLDLQGSEVAQFDATDDDLLTVNDVTVNRLDGGAGRATDDASVASVGRYARSVTISLQDQDRAAQHAAWRVHQGTVDEMRWPEITVIWGRLPGTVATAGGLLEVGDRIALENTPDWVGAADVELIVEGVRDSFDSAVWSTTYVCVPSSPWDVGIVEAGDARWDTVGDADDPDAYPPIYVGLA